VTTAVPTRLRAPALGRVAAAAAVGSATLHLVLATSGELSALAMALMALACLPCAWHLWRVPSASVWGLTALVDLGMLALHAPMVLGAGTHPATMHTATMHTATMHHATGPATAALVLVVGQLLLAATALLRR